MVVLGFFSAFNKPPRDRSKNRRNKKTNSIIIFVKGREIIPQPAPVPHNPERFYGLKQSVSLEVLESKRETTKPGLCVPSGVTAAFSGPWLGPAAPCPWQPPGAHTRLLSVLGTEDILIPYFDFTGSAQ